MTPELCLGGCLGLTALNVVTLLLVRRYHHQCAERRDRLDSALAEMATLRNIAAVHAAGLGG